MSRLGRHTLEPGDDRDPARVERLADAVGPDLEDLGLAVIGVGDDPGLRTRERHRRHAERLDRHAEQRHRDALARGEQHVHLAARRARSATSLARRTRSSVVLPIAETTTTTSSPARRVRAMWSATARIRSGSPTDVPPNFWTTRLTADHGTSGRVRPPEGIRGPAPLPSPPRDEGGQASHGRKNARADARGARERGEAAAAQERRRSASAIGAVVVIAGIVVISIVTGNDDSDDDARRTRRRRSRPTTRDRHHGRAARRRRAEIDSTRRRPTRRRSRRTCGEIVVELDTANAPTGAAHFIKLAREGLLRRPRRGTASSTTS